MIFTFRWRRIDKNQIEINRMAKYVWTKRICDLVRLSVNKKQQGICGLVKRKEKDRNRKSVEVEKSKQEKKKSEIRFKRYQFSYENFYDDVKYFFSTSKRKEKLFSCVVQCGTNDWNVKKMLGFSLCLEKLWKRNFGIELIIICAAKSSIK